MGICMQPYYLTHKLRFSCTGCGKCCSTAGDYHVYLTVPEADRIRNHLGLSPSWFRRRYLGRLEGGELVLAGNRQGGCVFLTREGKCRIYPVRPLQCSSYPFWPELVTSRAAWLAEQRRCEGIGRGAIVAVARIRSAVRQCLEQELELQSETQ